LNIRNDGWEHVKGRYAEWHMCRLKKEDERAAQFFEPEVVDVGQAKPTYRKNALFGRANGEERLVKYSGVPEP